MYSASRDGAIVYSGILAHLGAFSVNFGGIYGFLHSLIIRHRQLRNGWVAKNMAGIIDRVVRSRFCIQPHQLAGGDGILGMEKVRKKPVTEGYQ